MRIQIVEDEGVVALDIRRHLESFGYSVTGTHASGESAIAAFPEEDPNLVLMDIRLQGEMDGIEAAQIIRDRHRVPVIILTAFADEKTIERAKFIEPFGYIIKPFEERELRTNIEMAFFRHNLEKKLQESEERYRRFFQDDLSADFVADDAGTLIACNRSFVEYFRFKNSDEAEGTNIKNRFVDQERAEQFWRELNQKKRLELQELELIRNDNTPITMLANIVADSTDNGSLQEIKG
ncbi:MAG: response regulator, partial [Sediminispirochaetaceae bacterium]